MFCLLRGPRCVLIGAKGFWIAEGMQLKKGDHDSASPLSLLLPSGRRVMMSR